MAFEGGVFIDVLGRLNIPSFDRVLKDVKTMMREAGKTSGADFDKTFGEAVASGSRRAFDPLVEASDTAFQQMQLGMAELQRAEAQINNLRAQNFKRSTDAMINAQRELDAAIANTNRLMADSNAALLDRRAAAGIPVPGGRHSAYERTPSTGNNRAVAGRGGTLAEEGAVVAGAGYAADVGARAGEAGKGSELSQSFGEHVLAHRTAAALEKGGRDLVKFGGVGSLLGLAGASTYGVRADMRIQQNLNELRALQNESPANINLLSHAAWNQAIQTAYNTNDISKLYGSTEKAVNPLTGAQYRGRDAATVSDTALQLARIANVRPEVALQGLTTAMFNYHIGPAGSKGAGNILREGLAGFKGEAADYFEAQHTIDPVAQMAGINMSEILAMLDQMSQTGQSAQQSGQIGRNLIKVLARPNSVASAAMQQVGINPQDLSVNLSKNGIAGSLSIIDQALAAHAGPNGTEVLGALANKPLMQQQQQDVFNKLSPQAQAYVQSDAFQKSLVSGFKARNLILKAGGNISQTDMPLMETWLAQQKKIMGVSDLLRRNQPTVQNLYGAASSLYGSQEAAQAGLMLGGSPEALQAYKDRTAAMAGAQKHPNEFQKAFDESMSGQSMQWKKLEQELGKLAGNIGNDLLPTIQGVTHKFEDVMSFLDQHKTAQKVLIDAMLGLAGLYVAQKLKLGKALGFLLPGAKDNLKGMFGGKGGGEAAAGDIEGAMQAGGAKAAGEIGEGMTGAGVKAAASMGEAITGAGVKAAASLTEGVAGAGASMRESITGAGAAAGEEIATAMRGAGGQVAAEIAGAEESGGMPGGMPGGVPPGEEPAPGEPGKFGKFVKGLGGALKWVPYVGQSLAIGQEQDQMNADKTMKDYQSGKIAPGNNINQVGGLQQLGLLPKTLPPNPYKGGKQYGGFAGGGTTDPFSQPLMGVPDTGGDSVLGMLPNGTPVGLRGGEGILTPDAVAALGGPEGIDQINKNPWSNPAKVATTFYSSFAKGVAKYSPWGKYLVANSQSLSSLEEQHEQADKDQRREAGGYFAGIRAYMKAMYGSDAKYMPGYYNDMFGGQLGNVYKGSYGGGGIGRGSPEVMAAIHKAAYWSGLTGADERDLKWIFTRESSFDPTVSNGGGHGPPSNNKAFGLGQFLGHMGDKYGQMGAYSGDPYQETLAAIQYMKDRYGSVAGAKAYWATHGNYAKGGVVGYAGGGFLPLAPPPPPAPPPIAPLDTGGTPPGAGGAQVVQAPRGQQNYHFVPPKGATPPKGSPGYDPLHAYGGGPHKKPGPKTGSHHHSHGVQGMGPDDLTKLPGGTRPEQDRNIKGNPSQPLTSEGKGFGIGGGLIGAAESAAASMGGPFGAAAQPAFQLINRAIGYGGQLVGIGIKGLMETFLPNDSPAADPSRNIFGKIALGIAGAHKSPKNAAGAHAMQLHPKQDLDSGEMKAKQMPGIHVENIHNHTGNGADVMKGITKAANFAVASGAFPGI